MQFKGFEIGVQLGLVGVVVSKKYKLAQVLHFLVLVSN